MKIDNNYGFKSIKRLITLINKESERYCVKKTKIYCDMLYLFIKKGIGPNYYLLAGFSKPGVKFADKIRHLNTKEYNYCLNILNPMPYRKITQNKISEKAYLSLIDSPIAEFVGYYDNRCGFLYNSSKSLRNVEDLNELFDDNIGKKICLKLVEGWGGRGFLAGEIILKNDRIFLEKLFSEKIYSSEEILLHFKNHDQNGSFIIESYIEQDDFYKKFNTTSLNTARVWTLQFADGEVKSIGSNFRIGRLGSLTDNGDGGGIMCPVDMESGELGPGIFTDTSFREEMCFHPDTNAKISGVILERWGEIKRICEETLPKIPHTRFAGFDIAMSVEGPMIVEINVCPDKDGTAYGNCPSRILQENI